MDDSNERVKKLLVEAFPVVEANLKAGLDEMSKLGLTLDQAGPSVFSHIEDKDTGKIYVLHMCLQSVDATQDSPMPQEVPQGGRSIH